MTLRTSWKCLQSCLRMRQSGQGHLQLLVAEHHNVVLVTGVDDHEPGSLLAQIHQTAYVQLRLLSGAGMRGR